MPRDFIIWSAHIKHGTFQFRRRTVEHPAAFTFLVEIDSPPRHRGRLVEIQITHKLVAAAFINEAVQTLREKGEFLPDKMG